MPPSQERSRSSMPSFRHQSTAKSKLSSSYSNNSRQVHDQYWDPDTITASLLEGTIHRATIRFNSSNRTQAFCTISQLPSDVYIKGYKNQNRTVEGDEVVIQFFPPSEWHYVQKKVGSGARHSKNFGRKPSADATTEDSGTATSVTADDLLAFPAMEPSASGGDSPFTMANRANPFESTGTSKKKAEEDDVDALEMSVGSLSLAQQTSLLNRTSSNIDYENGAAGNSILSIYDIRNLLNGELKGWRATAKVVGIVSYSEKRENIIGVLQMPADGSDGMLLPRDTRLPPAIIKQNEVISYLSTIQSTHHADEDSQKAKDQKRHVKALATSTPVLVRAAYCTDLWTKTRFTPVGRIIKVLGIAENNLQGEIDAIIEMHNVHDDDQFTPEILSCLPALPWSITDADLSYRRDFRKHRVISIDPPTARDLDDALSVEVLENGVYRIGVHIADVSHFVLPGTALDEDAQNRSTSVYLVDRVIPMLPRPLCEDLCSLNPGVDRLSLSIVFDMTETGDIVDIWAGKTVIRSCAKLAYPTVQTIIDAYNESATLSSNSRTAMSTPSPPRSLQEVFQSPPDGVRVYDDHAWKDVAEDSLRLYKISKHLRKKRFDNGALRLDNVKLFFQLDEDGSPADFGAYVVTDANRLIEEFMLAANMAAARIIADAFPDRAMLRRHPPPNKERMEELKQTAEFLFPELPPIDVRSAGSIQRWLLEAKALLEDKDPAAMEVITMMCTRPMQLAEYFCTGDENNMDEWRHYALAVTHYTHFTSPIRRYPDILVHRTLMAALEKKNGMKMVSKKELVEKHGLFEREMVSSLAKHANDRKLAAKSAQDNALKVYLSYYLMEHPGVYDGIVTGVGGTDFFDVYVPALGVDVRVHVDRLLVGGEHAIRSTWNEETKEMLIQRQEGKNERATPDYTDINNFARLIEKSSVMRPVALPLAVRQMTPVPVVLGTRVQQPGFDVKIYAKLWFREF